MKDQFVANVIHLSIKHHQMYTHHHTTKVAKVVKATYYQVLMMMIYEFDKYDFFTIFIGL